MPSNAKTLRSGYTTGACATAATKGALLALLHQRRFAKSRIRLPIGQSVTFELRTCTYTPHEGYSSVIKDAGDDPDVTHQAEICARVTWAPGRGQREPPSVRDGPRHARSRPR
jgi:cobalt-precorrin-5B (C1)-methyltransferase